MFPPVPRAVLFYQLVHPLLTTAAAPILLLCYLNWAICRSAGLQGPDSAACLSAGPSHLTWSEGPIPGGGGQNWWLRGGQIKIRTPPKYYITTTTMFVTDFTHHANTNTRPNPIICNPPLYTDQRKVIFPANRNRNKFTEPILANRNRNNICQMGSRGKPGKSNESV